MAETSASSRRRRVQLLPSGRFPLEILFCNILPRLPLESLFRFKTVCKQWHATISIPSTAVFIPISDPSSLVFLPTLRTAAGLHRHPINFMPGNATARLTSSASGFLSLYLSAKEKEQQQLVQSLYVYNPATRERALIPGGGSRRSVGLAISASPAAYQLVNLTSHSAEEAGGMVATERGFEVFSSETGRWVMSSQKVRSRASFLSGGFGTRDAAVLSEGVLHWDGFTHLIYYDPLEDVAGAVKFPVSEEAMPHEIGEWEGRVTCTRLDEGRREVDVWVMSSRRDGGWERRHWVSLNGLFASSPLSIQRVQLVSFVGGDGRLYLWVWESFERKRLVYCDLVKASLLPVAVESSCLGGVGDIFPYQVSLAGLPKIAGQG